MLSFVKWLAASSNKITSICTNRAKLSSFKEIQLQNVSIPKEKTSPSELIALQRSIFEIENRELKQKKNKQD